MFAPDLTEGRLNCAGSRGGEFKSLHTTVSPACAGRVLRLRWKLFCYFPLLEGVLHLLRSVSLLEAWGFTWTLKRLCKQSNPPGWHISVCHCQVCSPTPYRFKGTEKIPRELGRSNVSAPLCMKEQDEHSKMTFSWALQRMSEQTNWLHEGRLRAQNPLMGLLFTAWDLP